MRDQEHSFAGVRTLVVGLAREGTALARFLGERGAQVTVTDLKPAEALVGNIQALQDWPITYALGGHPIGMLEHADIVFVSPGVPRDIPLLLEASSRGIPLSSETRLFLRLCPALSLGITGSSGKTTTTTLVARMLEASRWTTWTGGNIGQPLIGRLGDIAPSDRVVLELSSFQLEYFRRWALDGSEGHPWDSPAGELFDPRGVSPGIAAILNVTPNHLDRHATMEAYTAAKRRILAHQQPGAFAVLNRDDPVTHQIGQELAGLQQVVWFSQKRETGRGAFQRRDHLYLRWAERTVPICATGDLKLRGQHNVANVLAAVALAAAGGASVEAIREVATTFRGVEHRLELVLEHNAVRWYNDSIATTPERAVAALRSFVEPVVLLAGGRDKHLDWSEMANTTWQRARHLILFGEAAGLIEQAMSASEYALDGPCHIHQAGTLESAVALAAGLARPGDVVLLSPGGTSYDAYRDFEERGSHFRSLVIGLE